MGAAARYPSVRRIANASSTRRQSAVEGHQPGRPARRPRRPAGHRRLRRRLPWRRQAPRDRSRGPARGRVARGDGRRQKQAAGLVASPLLQCDLGSQEVDPGVPELVKRARVDPFQQHKRTILIAGVALAAPAATRRCARRAGSGVSVAARSRKAATAAIPRAPARVRRNARARRRRSRRERSPPGPDARPVGRGRARDRSNQQARGGSRGARSARPRRRPRSAPADAGTPRAGPGPTDPRIRRFPRPNPGSRAARPPATRAPGLRPARLPPPAAASGRRGKPSQAPLEALLDPGGEGQGRWQAEPSRELRGCQAAR